jgi:hypothetical protein
LPRWDWHWALPWRQRHGRKAVVPVVVLEELEVRPVVRLREPAPLAAVLATALERLPTKLARAERRQAIKREPASAIISGRELILQRRCQC